MLNQITVTDTAIDSLEAAAIALHEHYPQLSKEAVTQAVCSWLEGSIESLAEDALYHCIEGRDDMAFNRRGFTWAINRELEKIQPAIVAAAA
jgi:hypothetical protein